jgi:3-oxoacyl-[acyl-carrier protein] reductase
VLRDTLLFKMTDDDWTMVMDVHLRGAFLASQILQTHMVAANYGRITGQVIFVDGGIGLI